MKLPKLFSKKAKLALVLYRDHAEVYAHLPAKKAVLSKIGSLAYGSENAQFGDVYNPQALTKELGDFIISKKLGDFVAYLILSPELVFTGTNDGFLEKIPLTKDDLHVTKLTGDTKTMFFAVNKRFVTCVTNAVINLKAALVGVFVYDGKIPELEFVQKTMYTKTLDIPKLSL